MPAALLLQHAIEQAGSIDPDKVAAALNATDVTTFFGHVKFATDPKHHGLQIAHEMVLAQWQKKNGKLERQVVWPHAAQDRRSPLSAALNPHKRTGAAGGAAAGPLPAASRLA